MANDEGTPFSYPFCGEGAVRSADDTMRLRDFLSAQYRYLKNLRIAELSLSSGAGPERFSGDAIACVFLCHDDLRFLPSFLEHYRSMGVSRFICVDDRSTDGSREFLQAQEDVDLWVSARRYREARRGKVWREWLMCRYGFGRWYLNVDSDEYFIAPLHDQMPLSDYVAVLNRRAIRRVAAPMIDFYPRELEEAVFHGTNGEKPWEVAPLFDGGDYEGRLEQAGPILLGGVRRRVFHSDNHLMKYPLLYWDRACTLGASVHWPKPARYNWTTEWGVLLHFKIFSDLAGQVQQAIQEGQHMGGAENYIALKNHLEKAESSNFIYEKTINYTGPQSLRSRDFLKSAIEFRENT
ncbi:glycosyltransferase family 2 protein [Notoacmeibacter ruber]|uniref:Glycosyltransferase family 2 protein n=1 Tax=Notoacmeibacter ruber TaxID=2670375 RepID=A0A3L7JC27_9HYPH|nr:glycosyltransferase family 2 protein [Notoacmeibacter ruber]RLQ88308.1 glycosyltransferase family 2 protein [Notoacmeibacter ruber]